MHSMEVVASNSRSVDEIQREFTEFQALQRGRENVAINDDASGALSAKPVLRMQASMQRRRAQTDQAGLSRLGKVASLLTPEAVQ